MKFFYIDSISFPIRIGKGNLACYTHAQRFAARFVFGRHVQADISVLRST